MNPIKNLVDATVVLMAAARGAPTQAPTVPKAQERRYDAANRGRLGKMHSYQGLADRDNKLDGKTLRDMARDLDQNHDIARAILDSHVDNIVGQGLQPFPGVELNSGGPAVDFNRELRDLYKSWCRTGMVDGLHVIETDRLACRSWLRDGEIFDIHLEGRYLDRGRVVDTPPPPGVVPYLLQTLETEYVPWDFNDEAREIAQGIQKTEFGHPLTYFIGKPRQDFVNQFGIGQQSELAATSAEQVTHLKWQTRLGQTRGTSLLAPVLTRLEDLKSVEEAERVAARMSASMALQIIRGGPDGYQAPSGDEEFPEMSFVPGMVITNLQAGERVEAFESGRPNVDLIAFAKDQVKKAAAGSGTSGSTISRNYEGTYTAERQQLVEVFQHYGILWHKYVSIRERAKWERFVRMAATSGTVRVPAAVNRDTILLVDYSRPVIPWIDPQKETAALEKMIELRIRSRAQIMRERGWDVDETSKQIAEEIEEAAALLPPTDEGSNDVEDQAE